MSILKQNLDQSFQITLQLEAMITDINKETIKN